MIPAPDVRGYLDQVQGPVHDAIRASIPNHAKLLEDLFSSILEAHFKSCYSDLASYKAASELQSPRDRHLTSMQAAIPKLPPFIGTQDIRPHVKVEPRKYTKESAGDLIGDWLCLSPHSRMVSTVVHITWPLWKRLGDYENFRIPIASLRDILQEKAILAWEKEVKAITEAQMKAAVDEYVSQAEQAIAEIRKAEEELLKMDSKAVEASVSNNMTEWYCASALVAAASGVLEQLDTCKIV